MAKEYFHLQNQYFQFNDDDNTITIASSNEKSKDLAVQHLTELQFQGQLFTFKGNVLRSMAAAADGITDPSMAGPLFEYSTEEVFNTKDQTKQEVIDFLENLTQEQFKKIETFFLTMPKLQQKVEYDCPVCNKHHVKTMEGLASFF
jgi:hypothetical protein